MVETSRAEENPEYQPSLAKAIFKSFGPFYLCLGSCTFIEECLIRVFQPLFMGRNGGVSGFGKYCGCSGWMIEYFSAQSEVTLTEATCYGAGVVGTAALYNLIHHAYLLGTCNTGMQVRVACCSLLYRKALKLSSSAMGQTTIGQMVNLLSNDVNRFDTTVMFTHYLWVGPLQLVTMTFLLCKIIGPSAFVGAALLVASVPLQSK